MLTDYDQKQTHQPMINTESRTEWQMCSYMRRSTGQSLVQIQKCCWTYPDSLSTGSKGTTLSEIWIKIQNMILKKMYGIMSSANWWRFCSGHNIFQIRYQCVVSMAYVRSTGCRQVIKVYMMTSWHGYAFCITGPLWWESTRRFGIRLTRLVSLGYKSDKKAVSHSMTSHTIMNWWRITSQHAYLVLHDKYINKLGEDLCRDEILNSQCRMHHGTTILGQVSTFYAIDADIWISMTIALF